MDKNKPPEYYTEKLYTQFDLDEAVKKLTKSPFDAVPISSGWLEQNNWIKNGSIWEKNGNTIKFDGAKWWLNGSEITRHIQDLPK